MTTTSNIYRPAPATPQEIQDVDTLRSTLMSDLSFEAILSVLRRHKGDVEKAASALLEGDKGDSPPPYNTLPANFGKDNTQSIGPRTPPPSKPEKTDHAVIDLTADEDPELSKALQASLEDQGPHFGPSQRAPDPSWAMVPSNAPSSAAPPGMSEEESLQRAIEQSRLEASAMEENWGELEELPLENRIRIGDRSDSQISITTQENTDLLYSPVALRPTNVSMIYASLIVHALFFVPQVRYEVAQWRYIPTNMDESESDAGPIEVTPPQEGDDFVMWSLQETFINMDLARITDLNVDQAMLAFEPPEWKFLSESIGDLAHQFYNKLTWVIENRLQEGRRNRLRLFWFRYGFSDAEPYAGPLNKTSDMCIVKVTVRGTSDANDLLSCLSLELAPTSDNGPRQVISTPSSVVAFELLRHVWPSSPGNRQAFSFPPYVYLDQFLRENAALAEEKRKQQTELQTKVIELQRRRAALTSHNNRDTLADLRSSIYYYENVAEDDEDSIRKDAIAEITARLKASLAKIEEELQNIDRTITEYQQEVTRVFDTPEFQKHRYDLRAVLVHSGQYGRSHVYSYVQHGGLWYHIVDHTVTEVPEKTVFNDDTGLYYNAGPFLLIYSRAYAEDEYSGPAPWPEGLKDSVKHNNKEFFASLPEDVLANIEDPNSPPTMASSAEAEPPTPRSEAMDLS
ncbi:hypothetical protein K474DRAFT_1695753 [Panus rudis PR-1116 ss-1]|nr:hypothetical protein K474DRAFT_1695753 [Panus rudis PR-1116 ss-1]